MNHKLFAYSVTILLITTCCITSIKTSLGNTINSPPPGVPISDANGPYYGIVNQEITFDGSNSYDNDGTIIIYEWFCGDGMLETGEITKHIYTTPGIYTLILLVGDNDGNYDCDETEVIINEDKPPVLEIIHPIEKSIYFNDFYLFPYEKDTVLIGTINFTANATDDVEINRVEFYIDNNLQYTDYNPPYNYIMPKGHLRHSLKVIAYDSSGKQTSTELEFFQWKSHPIFIIFICYLLLRNNDNSFDWFSDENQWSSFIIDLLKKLDLDSKDDKTLKEFLDVIKNKKNDIKTSIIIEFLNNHPYLKNKFRQTYPFIYFLLFYVKNENSFIKDKILESFYKDKNIISILFSIPSIREFLRSSDKFNSESFDASIPIEWIKDHPFVTASTLLLLILILRNLGSNDSDDNQNSDESDTMNMAPVARAGGPYIGYVNSPVSFSAENSYDSDGRIITYEWDFGDGNSGNGEKTQHTYTQTGNYTITLMITDDNGKTDYDSSKVNILDSNSKTINETDEDNEDYVIISGFLSAILIIGLIGLRYRRKLFE
jgi:PKD repeat protein